MKRATLWNGLFALLISIQNGLAQKQPSTPPTTLPAADLQVFEEVKALYATTRGAVRTIDVTYNQVWVGRRNSCCHFISDGEKYYAANAAAQADGTPIGASEQSWDGSRDYVREIGLLSISNQRRLTQVECSQPYGLVDGGAGLAFGVDRFELPDHSYRLESATWEKTDRERRARLAFTYMVVPEQAVNGRHQGLNHALPIQTLEVVLSSAVDYLPVEFTIRWPQRIERSANLTYQRIDDHGQTLFCPQHVERISTINGKTIDLEIINITQTVLNKLVPHSQFTMEPWPNQRMLDTSTGQTTPAAQPGWDDSQVGYPFGDVIRRLQQIRDRSKELVPSTVAG